MTSVTRHPPQLATLANQMRTTAQKRCFVIAEIHNGFRIPTGFHENVFITTKLLDCSQHRGCLL